jgi:hypothetical protein
MRIKLLAVTLSAIAASPAMALVPGTGLSIGVTGGTLGVGPEVGLKLNPLIGLRASASFLNFSGHGHVSDYGYEGHAHLGNFGGMVDLHPFLNGFRISAGVRDVSSNHIRFKGMATSDQTYGGVTFTPDEAGTLSGRIRARSVAPVATIGFAHTVLPGVYLGLDGGVLFQGHPRVTDIATTGELATNPSAQDSLNDQIGKLRNRVRDYPYYPVAQLSLGYRF